VVKVLQGSVVTQTMLGRLTISSDCEFPMVYIIENWLAVDKVIAKISRLTFWPTLYIAAMYWRYWVYNDSRFVVQHKHYI